MPIVILPPLHQEDVHLDIFYIHTIAVYFDQLSFITHSLRVGRLNFALKKYIRHTTYNIYLSPHNFDPQNLRKMNTLLLFYDLNFLSETQKLVITLKSKLQAGRSSKRLMINWYENPCQIR